MGIQFNLRISHGNPVYLNILFHTFSPVSQEVGVPESGVCTQPTSGPDVSSQPQEHWSSWDKDKLQVLSEGDIAAVCVKQEEEDTQPPSCRQTQTDTVLEELLPSTSGKWMKTEEEDNGYGRSEAAPLWQPLPLDSLDENENSDADYTEGRGSNSCLNTVTSKINAKQILNSPNKASLSCKMCGESFHSRSSLAMHVKSHSNNTPALFPPDHSAAAAVALADGAMQALEAHRSNNLCYICGKTFSTRTHLKRHMLVHTGQKPHCCKICGRRFARGECLRIHMRIHTVEKPYTCEVCGRGFRQRGNMICHIRTHTGEKPHRCVICSRPFAYKKDMLRHMQIHSKKT